MKEAETGGPALPGHHLSQGGLDNGLQAPHADAREYVYELFIFLNKVDYVDEAQLQEALECTTQVLQANLATEPMMIFPLSAKLALDGKIEGRIELLEASWLLDFENYLRQFLYKEKGRVQLISCISGALKTIAGP
jgi:hypothetical protein